MSRNAIEKGRRYFCREETTGKRYSGMFHIDEDEMQIELFGFDDDQLVERFDNLLIVRLEDNRIVSAHDNITNGPSSNISIERGVQSSSTSVTSNAIVIGEDAWHPDDPVRRVQFSIEHAEVLLLNRERFDAIAEATIDDLADLTLINLHVGDISLRVRYTPRGDLRFKRATEIGIRYELEFETPRRLTTFLDDVMRVVRFLSAARGHRLGSGPIDITGSI